MKLSRIVLAVAAIVLTGAIAVQARSMLEKKLYYVSAGKVQEAKFWQIFMGSYDLTLKRKIPGEGEQQVKATMNLSLLSSGYIEGTGYADKLGKITCIGYFAQAGTTKLPVDSIEYVYDYGSKAKRLNGADGELFIDVEGTQVSPRWLKMTYWSLVNNYGEDMLREPKDVTINGFAFTKESAQKGAAAEAALPPPPAPSGN